jgi:hypothetical protein
MGDMDQNFLNFLYTELDNVIAPAHRKGWISSNWKDDDEGEATNIGEMVNFFKLLGTLAVAEQDPALIPALSRLLEKFKDRTYVRCFDGFSDAAFIEILESWRGAISDLEEVQGFFTNQGVIPEREQLGFLGSRRLWQIAQTDLPNKPRGMVSISHVKKLLKIKPSFIGDSNGAMSSKMFMELCEFFPAKVEMYNGDMIDLPQGDARFLRIGTRKDDVRSKINKVTWEISDGLTITIHAGTESACLFRVDKTPTGMDLRLSNQIAEAIGIPMDRLAEAKQTRFF